jgi:hypothetical protein
VPSHVPSEAKQHVTNPVRFPHVERAAQRVTVPLQLVGSSPLPTASRTAWATQLTYRPWFVDAVQTHVLAMRARTTSAAAGSSQRAPALGTQEPEITAAARTVRNIRDVMSPLLSEWGGG